MALTLMKGSEAIAEAAIRAGARFFFGYPITPQTEIPEYMAARMPEVGGCFLQAESEVAAINMVYGAAGTGARVVTSSSSPGVSLKQEGISYCAGAQVPCLIIQCHDHRLISRLSRDDLTFYIAAAAKLAIESGYSIFRTLLDRIGNGIFRQCAVASALLRDLVPLVLQRFQMTGGHHLRDSGAYIKIAQTFILITQLIQFLHGHGIAGAGGNK